MEKGKKERYKSNENLTRKSKVSCIAVVPFFTFILLTLTKAEWGAPIEFAHGSSNARGVAVLLRNSFDCKIKRSIVDPMGRFIGIKAESRMKTIFCLMFTHLTMIVNPQGFMNILLIFFKYTKIK